MLCCCFPCQVRFWACFLVLLLIFVKKQALLSSTTHLHQWPPVSQLSSTYAVSPTSVTWGLQLTPKSSCRWRELKAREGREMEQIERIIVWFALVLCSDLFRSAVWVPRLMDKSIVWVLLRCKFNVSLCMYVRHYQACCTPGCFSQDSHWWDKTIIGNNNNLENKFTKYKKV